MGTASAPAPAAAMPTGAEWPLPWPFPWRWPLPLCPLPGSGVPSAGPITVLRNPLRRKRTSAEAVGRRASLPLKRTSSIRSPRRLLALCSPITHVMASATLLLPQPLGPTMAVTPASNASSERSENDLKPLISRRCRRMRNTTDVEYDVRIPPEADHLDWLGYRPATEPFGRPLARRSEDDPGPLGGGQ